MKTLNVNLKIEKSNNFYTFVNFSKDFLIFFFIYIVITVYKSHNRFIKNLNIRSLKSRRASWSRVVEKLLFLLSPSRRPSVLVHYYFSSSLTVLSIVMIINFFLQIFSLHCIKSKHETKEKEIETKKVFKTNEKKLFCCFSFASHPGNLSSDNFKLVFNRFSFLHFPFRHIAILKHIFSTT